MRRAGLLALLLAAPLSAQSPAQRDAVQLFRDSLLLTSDTMRLHDAEARGIAAAKADRDNAVLHLRLGFTALRINELDGDAGRVGDAESEFEWAAELQPAWPYPWFGLGLAESREPDRVRGFAGGLWSMFGVDRDTRAGAAFARSLQADPGFVDGLIAFAQIAESDRLDAPVMAALRALRVAQASPLGWDPRLLLERGRLERMAGFPDSARIAFQRALQLDVAPAMIWLELARTLPLTADTVPSGPDHVRPSEVAYFTAATSDDPDVVAMVRRDLQPIVADSDLAAFDRLHGAARAAWLHTFWRQRAALDLRSVGERLDEHFRRWDFALRNFRLPPFKRDYRWGIETYQSRDPELDDRGIVWIRQGRPTVRIVWPRSLPRSQTVAAAQLPVPVDPSSLAAAAAAATRRELPAPQHVVPASLIIDPPVGAEAPSYGNETWRYARPDGDLVVNFAAQDDPDDYRLVESILQLDVSLDAMYLHAGELPGLAALLRAGPMTQSMLAEETRLAGRRAMATATTTSAWPRWYPIRLASQVQWLVAGTRDGKPLVHIVYSVDAAALRVVHPDPAVGGVPVRLRAVFFGTANRVLATLDTVQWFAPPPANAVVAAARAELPVPPGMQRMRLNVEINRAIGAVYPADSLLVPDFGGRHLTMSSVMLGVPGRSLAWSDRHADTVWLAAQSVYHTRDTVAIYAQAFGVRPGTPYSVRVIAERRRSFLHRLLGGASDAVTISGSTVFADSSGTVRRLIPLAGLSPGNYRLVVELEGSGERIERDRGLFVER